MIAANSPSRLARVRSYLQAALPAACALLPLVFAISAATAQETVIVVGSNTYSAFSTALTNGQWVYVDADPAAGSPVRATQRALGYREVDYKAAVPATLYFNAVTPVTNGNTVTYDYTAQVNKTNLVGFWVSKDLPIIIGPDGNAYITDGHHTTAGYLAAASPVRPWIEGRNRIVTGHIVANYFDTNAGPQAVNDTWWTARQAENNALLYGVDGDQLTLPGEPNYAGLQPILPSALAMPTTPSNVTTNGVIAMTNSLYRALTWGLADGIIQSATAANGSKIAGYKKSAPGSSVDINFVEFFWADYLRNRITWDNSLSGSPLGSPNGDANATAAPLSFFAAVANGIALARSEVYRDEYGRRIFDYTNSALFSPNAVNWASGSVSNGLALTTDTYNLYLRDDSTIVGDIWPSAKSTNILHIDTVVGLTVTQSLQNIRTILVNAGGTLRTTWKDTTVSNTTLRLPAGTGTLTVSGINFVAPNTILGGGTLLVEGTLGGSLSVTNGLLNGNGLVNGALAVSGSGTLAPGTSIGTLTINGPLTLSATTAMELNKTGTTLTNDLVNGITTLFYGGTLVLTGTGDALTAGDAFKIFEATTYSGSFAALNLPALGDGLTWDSSQLITSGTIRVVAAGSPKLDFAAQPASRTNDLGTSPTLVGGAVGTEPITYQWQFNGDDLSGKTNTTLTLANILENNQGAYTLIANNAAGSVTSAVAVLTVNQAPTAQAQALSMYWNRTNNIVLAGSDLDADTLTFTVVNQPANGVLSGSAPNLTYTPTTGFSGPDSFTFRVNDGRLSSATATVAINVKRDFSYQDTDLLLVFRKSSFNDLLFNLGSVSNYLGQANGATWSVTNFNLARIASVFGGDLSGVKYSFAAVTTASDAPLRAWLSDAAPGTPNDETFSKWASQRSKINAVGVRAMAYSYPDAADQSLSISPNDPNSYTYVASTGGSLDAATLSGASPFPVEQDVTGTVRFFELKVSTTLPKPAAVQVGSFTIDGSGNVTFTGGVVPPAISSQPQSLTNLSGTAAFFSLTVTGDQPLSYQWYFNNSPISGATSSSYDLPAVSALDAGGYYAVASNGGGSATSSLATLTVIRTAIISQSPTNLSVCERFPATFSVAATGDAPLSYQWRFNGVNLSGATASSYTIASATTNQAGNYDVVVNNYATSAVAVLTVTPTFAGFVNKGLVGVGRLNANTFDSLGAGVDTMGGIFSAMFLDQTTLVRTGDETSGYSYAATLYGLPDRGFGDGAQDYHPRVQTMIFSIAPYYGNAPTSQTQIVFAPVATTLFTYGGTNFTGYDPDDLTVTNFPQSSPGSLGQGKRSLDSEGLVRTADGGFFVSDEYGPSITRFDATGALQYTLLPPEGLIPRRGAYPGTNVWTGTNNPTSGRRSNRGFEGLTLMPDGKRLATVLQSPAIQDGGASNPSRNTRLLIFDIDNASPTFGRAIAEYIYQLTLNGATATNRHTPLSELLALNNDQFLVLERDGIGLGALPAATPIYKRVNVLSTRGATNIINTGYDLELGAPSQLSLPQGTLPSNVGAVQRFDLVNIIDTNQLVKFGLNISTNQDQNTIGEKWEGLALIPLNDPAFPSDFLLLVGNDNDFKATNVYHNGVVVGTNDVTLDNMLLAYRVTLPLCDTNAMPGNAAPFIVISSPTNATFSAPAALTLTASAYDQDGLVTNVNFYLSGSFVGNDTTFPFQYSTTGVAAGSYDFTAVAFDQSGASSTSVVKTVVVTVENLAPTVAITSPANGANVRANANLTVLVSAGDADGTIANAQLYDGGLLIASSATAPFTTIAPNIAPGSHSYSVVAYDNQGATATSSVVNVTAFIAPAIATAPQGGTITMGGDFTFAVTANGDVPFSYQWRQGTNSIPGATNDTYSVSNAPTTASGNYQVVISNLGGSITSAVAVLVVKPGFTYQDTDLLLTFRKAGFNDLLFNLGSVSNYLGQVNGTMSAVTNFDMARVSANFGGDLSGVKYALLAVTPADDGVLRAWLSDAAPGIPNDETFSKWASQRSKINAMGVRATAYGYPAATNQSLSLPPSDPNSYSYIASTGGSLDAATLSGAAPFPIEQDLGTGIRLIELRVSTQNPKPAATQVGHFNADASGNLTFTGGFIVPAIVVGPVNAVANCNTGSAGFTVAAAGDEPLSYQWYFGNNPLGGATADSLSISPTIPATAGSYFVVVSNPGGSVTSSVVSLTITDTVPPVVSVPGALIVTRTSASGAVVNFSTSATDACAGSLPVICTPASGSTFPVGTTTVNCVANDGSGNSTTNSFTVTVQPGFAYQDTDLLFVLRKGGFNDLLFNLGSVSNYLGQPNGSMWNVTNFDLPQVAANFGGDLAGVKYAILAVTTASDTPLRVWMSDAAPGTVLDETFSKWASQRSKINAVGLRATAYSFPEATNQSLSLPPSDPNSYTYIASTGGSLDAATLSGAAPFPVEQDVTNSVRFFEIKVSTGNPKPASVQVGSFTVDGAGNLTFAANQVPVANDDGATTLSNQPLNISSASLLANDTDPDGDALSVPSVSGTSTNGGTVILSNGTVTYTPAPDFSGTDRFTYSISDGRGGSATANVEVYVSAMVLPAPNHVSISRTASGFSLLFNGVPGQTYTIERATNLSGPGDWAPLTTVVAPLTGIITFDDPNPPAAQAFYKLSSQ